MNDLPLPSQRIRERFTIFFIDSAKNASGEPLNFWAATIDL